MGGEKRAGALSDTSNDAVLICERIATRLEHDLLERRHRDSAAFWTARSFAPVPTTGEPAAIHDAAGVAHQLR